MYKCTHCQWVDTTAESTKNGVGNDLLGNLCRHTAANDTCFAKKDMGVKPNGTLNRRSFSC